MTRAGLFVTIAAIAILSGGPVGARPTRDPSVVLYSQNGNFGGSVNSQNYESSMSEYDDAAADDFVVPSGVRWRISQVDVTGKYLNGHGPASSVIVAFYTNKNDLPYKVARGKGERDYFTLNCADNAGSFTCKIPKPGVTLRAGTYWLSVVANCDYQTCGQWEWTETTTVTGNQAVWQNPNGGFSNGCNNVWEPLFNCFGVVADLAFELKGTAHGASRSAR